MSTIQAFFQSCRMFANQSFQKVIHVREIVKILGTKELERQTKSVEPNVLILNGCSIMNLLNQSFVCFLNI